jgi:hypothetical protein
MKTRKQFVAEFKEKNPIVETSGTGSGTYKYQRYLTGIDLRYGFTSRKAAEMDRAKTANAAYYYYADGERIVVCASCKSSILNRQTHEGRCINCYGK